MIFSKKPKGTVCRMCGVEISEKQESNSLKKIQISLCEEHIKEIKNIVSPNWKTISYTFRTDQPEEDRTLFIPIDCELVPDGVKKKKGLLDRVEYFEHTYNHEKRKVIHDVLIKDKPETGQVAPICPINRKLGKKEIVRLKEQVKRTMEIKIIIISDTVGYTRHLASKVCSALNRMGLGDVYERRGVHKEKEDWIIDIYFDREFDFNGASEITVPLYYLMREIFDGTNSVSGSWHEFEEVNGDLYVIYRAGFLSLKYLLIHRFNEYIENYGDAAQFIDGPFEKMYPHICKGVRKKYGNKFDKLLKPMKKQIKNIEDIPGRYK